MRVRPRQCKTAVPVVRLVYVEEMPAGGSETKRLQSLIRDLGGMDPREPEGLHASRAELIEQLPQTGSTIVDERAERNNLRLLHSARHSLLRDFR
jgi:hypothetical protein